MTDQLSDFEEIDKIDDQIEELDKDAEKAEIRRRNLLKACKRLELELEALKEWIWDTDDPNIVELRRQLLAAARLVKEREEISDEELEEEIDRQELDNDELWPITRKSEEYNDILKKVIDRFGDNRGQWEKDWPNKKWYTLNSKP